MCNWVTVKVIILQRGQFSTKTVTLRTFPEIRTRNQQEKNHTIDTPTVLYNQKKPLKSYPEKYSTKTFKGEQ